ncbi:hypothetical protein SLS54_010156 [Diplodia seriata]
MTLIFRPPNNAERALQGWQVGTADVLATYTSLHSAWGWLRGLSSVRDILSHFRGSVISAEQLDRLGVHLSISPVDAIIITSDGMRRCQRDETEDAFNGDPRTQLIGMTLCALDHELGRRLALELFMEYLGPVLFSGLKELKESLQGQISDCLVRIINEGNARGFTERFLAAIEASGLPHGRGDRFDDVGGKSDIKLVAGLLIWIAEGSKSTYLTRSSRVVRVACCLKEIGYPIGKIEFWGGEDAQPYLNQPRNLVLVLGGTIETDHLSTDFERSDGGSYLTAVYHYHLRTAGAMFCNAFNDNNNFAPEEFQTRFDNTITYIKKHLRFEWRCEGGRNLKSPIRPHAVWDIQPMKTGMAQAIRLASIRFNKSAEYLAPCYQTIIHDMQEIVEYEKNGGLEDTIPESVIDHRVITASVILSVADRLAPDSFDTCRHSCKFSLADPDWLDQMAPLVDRILASHNSVRLQQAVAVLAVVHSAAPHENFDDKYTMDYARLIGWREGTYAVVPSLLLQWAPVKESLGLHCMDKFWANAVVYSDGSIQSAESPFLSTELSAFDTSSGAGAIVGDGPYAGPPICGFAEDPLHLSLERSARVETPDLGICARVDGESIGFVGISDVLRTLADSLTAVEDCGGHAHAEQPDAYNVRTRAWCVSRTKKPTAKGLVTLVSAKDDRLWSVFLAGQSGFGLTGRVSYGCFRCSSHGLNEQGFVVGFKEAQ